MKSCAPPLVSQMPSSWALDLAIRMMDLTTLEGKDTPGKVRALCAKGMHPDPADPSIPSVAAICIYPAHIPVAKEALKGSASRSPPSRRLPGRSDVHRHQAAETRQAAEAGADEIDMVIDRGAFLSGDYATVFDEIVAVKEACGAAHLKVILETGELETFDNVRRASSWRWPPAPTSSRPAPARSSPRRRCPVTLVMLEAIRDFHRRPGRVVGMKPAGGIRTAKEAIAATWSSCTRRSGRAG